MIGGQMANIEKAYQKAMRKMGTPDQELFDEIAKTFKDQQPEKTQELIEITETWEEKIQENRIIIPETIKIEIERMKKILTCNEKYPVIINMKTYRLRSEANERQTKKIKKN